MRAVFNVPTGPNLHPMGTADWHRVEQDYHQQQADTNARDAAAAKEVAAALDHPDERFERANYENLAEHHTAKQEEHQTLADHYSSQLGE